MISNMIKMISQNFIILFLAITLTATLPIFAESSAATNSNDDECDWENLIPGLAKSGRAVDITSLNYFPKDQDMQTLNGFGNALFDFTCSKKRKWHNAVTNISYWLPDQVASVNIEPVGQLSETVTVHQALDSVKSVMDIHGGIGIKNGSTWGISLDGGYKQTEDTLQTGNFTIIDVSAMATAYSINYYPFSVLKTIKGFPEILDQLSDDYKSDPSLYDLVLETYGTHYLSSVKLGGYLVMRTMVNTSYLTSDNNKTIYGNIAANFKQMVNVNGSAEISNSSSHVIFDENTRTNYYYYGGRDGVKNGAMTSEEFKEWVLSVHAVPWMFGGKLTPISFLIQKPNIRAQMELATNVKHNKAILERFENALKLINKENDPVMSTIIKLLSQTVPEFEEIVEVGKTVSKIISDNLSDKPRLGSSEVEELQNGIKHEISGTVRNVVKLF